MLVYHLVITAYWGVLSLSAAVKAIQIIGFKLLSLVQMVEAGGSATKILNHLGIKLVMPRWLLLVSTNILYR